MASISLMLWTSKDSTDTSLLKEIDGILLGYKYYPEYEWSKHKVRPPENFSLIGSWKKIESGCFVFLMQNYNLKNREHYVIYISGNKDEIDRLERQIVGLKGKITKTEKRSLRNQNVESALEKEHKTKTTKKLITIVGVFTAIINAFSYYLIKLPTPSFNNEYIKNVYEIFIILIHFLALVLLLLVILLIISYVIKYGILILRRR